MKRPVFLILLVSWALVTWSCKKQNDAMTASLPKTEFSSYEDFILHLEEYSAIEDENLRDSVLSVLLDQLEVTNRVPYTDSNKVAFLYYGTASSVKWAGDFNGWNPNASGWKGSQLNKSNLYLLEKEFPTDARLDYKLVIGSNWILDPLNNYIQYSGFGPNSELRMPDWVYPSDCDERSGISKGTLSGNQIIYSQNLNYSIQYKIYTPSAYDALDSLPCIYVTDGHEYSDPLLGSMIQVLDNLIADGKIQPVMAVFIDPRNPDNLSENRRADQYRGNPHFGDFVSEELVPLIDSVYKSIPNPNRRAILGTSYGGWNSCYFGLYYSSVFGQLGVMSPAFDQSILQAYSSSDKLPLNFFLCTGVIHDTEDNARALKQVLIDKNYGFDYKEVNEGHSWGNWRALIDDFLIYFYRE